MEDEGNTRLKKLTEFMRELSGDEAKRLAFEIAEEVNLALQLGYTPLRPHLSNWPVQLSSMLEGLSVTPSSLALPWQAYQLSRLDRAYEQVTPFSRVVSILATMPSAYGMRMSPPHDVVGPYAGSLLEYLAGLLENASTLFIVNPYWSVQGTRELARRLRPSTGRAGRATIMTRAQMGGENLHGLGDFLRLLHERGYALGYWTPLVLPTSDHPLLHAKVVIADRKRAYIGSANLTDSGLNRSIEVGVALEGAVVGRLQDWLENMLCNFEEIEFVL